MESEAVLRKLLLVAFLSVVSTGMPAYAVDYIACREMLRTKNEFMDISSQYEKGDLRTRNIYGIDPRQKCRDITNKEIEEYTKLTNNIDKNLYMENIVAKDESGKCERAIIDTREKRRNPKEIKSRGLYLRTDEGHYYYKKALKVEADMRKANCPY